MNNCQQFSPSWCCALWEYPHRRGSVCAFGQWKSRKATAAAASSGTPEAAWASCPALEISVCCCRQSWDPLSGWGTFMAAGIFSACMEAQILYKRTALLEHLPRICVSSPGRNGLKSCWLVHSFSIKMHVSVQKMSCNLTEVNYIPKGRY